MVLTGQYWYNRPVRPACHPGASPSRAVFVSSHGLSRIPAIKTPSTRTDCDKRRRILDAAERLFADQRYHEVTTDAVARAAQVSKGTIYRFFNDKDELFFHAATAGFDDLCRRLEAFAFDADRPHESLTAACEAMAGFFQRKRRVMHLIQAEESRAAAARGKARQRWGAQRGRLVAALATVMRQGQCAAAMRDDLPPDVLAALLLGLMRARARDLGPQGSTPDQNALSLQQLVDLFLRGAGRDQTPMPRRDARAAARSRTRNPRRVQEQAT
jgi:AcrR family transcriptional regulator